MSHTSPELSAAADEAGLSIETLQRRTGKTLLARGRLAGIPAAVKFLVDSDLFWAAKWRHELDVYEIFSDTPPPVRVPRLLYTDNDRLLVLEWIDGQPLADQRYPQQALTRQQSDAVLTCITALNGWTGAAGRLSPTFDYAERLIRYHTKGYLTDADLNALQRLLSQCGVPGQVNHGDPLASNILLAPTGETILLDWEFTGLFLPGFDLAMLHTQLGTATPGIRQRIDAIVDEMRTPESFAVNLAIVLTRELRLHHELPAKIRHVLDACPRLTPRGRRPVNASTGSRHEGGRDAGRPGSP